MPGFIISFLSAADAIALVGVPYQCLVIELASPTPPFGVINNGFPHPNKTGTIFTLANVLEIQNYQHQYGKTELMNSNNLPANCKAQLLQDCNADSLAFAQKLAYYAIQCLANYDPTCSAYCGKIDTPNLLHPL